MNELSISLLMFTLFMLWLLWHCEKRRAAAHAKHEAQRINLIEGRRWLAEFPEIAMTLDALLDDDSGDQPINFVKLREALRHSRH